MRSLRRNIALLLGGIAIPAFLMMYLMPNIIFPKYDIFPGGKQEPFGYIMQMTARIYIEHGQELGKEDLKTIDDVMDLSKVPSSYSNYN